MPRIQNKIPVAAGGKHPFDLSFSHVTTMDFMRLQPVAYRHCIDDENLDMSAFATVRPAPIEVPTFGRCHLSLRSFFVPYEQIFPNYHAFKQDVITSNFYNSSLVSSVPAFYSDTLWSCFVGNYMTNVTVNDPWDFSVDNNYYQLTPDGRRAYKILTSLGYRLIPHNKNYTPILFNALGLLAFAKAYVDWYANKNYMNSYEVLTLERLFKFNDPAGQLILSAADLVTIFSLTSFVVYDNESYFNDAWDNPLGPISGQSSTFSFVDPTGSVGSALVMTGANGTPEMLQTSNTSVSVGTQYIHDALKRLTDYQKMHALAGASQIERFLVEAGYVPESLKLTRSIYVGHQNIDIQIGDIYGTAASTDGTNSSTIGDYAGRGFGQGSKNWTYHADQQGVFLVLASIVPDSCFVQGYDRNNRLLNKTDFFTNKFDGLSTQIIEKGEVYVSNVDTFVNDDPDYTGKYAYTGRYGEKKRPLNFLTGDLSLPSFYSGAPSWHMFRLVNDASFSNSINNVVHSLDFTRGVDAYRLDRIFQNTSPEYEHFYVFLDFNFHTQSNCKPLFDTYEFDEESAKYITLGSGPKVN